MTVGEYEDIVEAAKLAQHDRIRKLWCKVKAVRVGDFALSPATSPFLHATPSCIPLRPTSGAVLASLQYTLENCRFEGNTIEPPKIDLTDALSQLVRGLRYAGDPLILKILGEGGAIASHREIFELALDANSWYMTTKSFGLDSWDKLARDPVVARDIAHKAASLIRYWWGEKTSPELAVEFERSTHHLFGKDFDPITKTKALAGRHRNICIPAPHVTTALRLLLSVNDDGHYMSLDSFANFETELAYTAVGVDPCDVLRDFIERHSDNGGVVDRDVKAWESSVNPHYFEQFLRIVLGKLAGTEIPRAVTLRIMRTTCRLTNLHLRGDKSSFILELNKPAWCLPSGVLYTLLGNTFVHAAILVEGGLTLGDFLVQGDDVLVAKCKLQLLESIYTKHLFQLKQKDKGESTTFCGFMIKGLNLSVDEAGILTKYYNRCVLRNQRPSVFMLHMLLDSSRRDGGRTERALNNA
jgi:hypothetical protein